MERTYEVPGISCDHCKRAIEGEVGTVEGVESVEVHIDDRVVVVNGGADRDIRAAIEEAGYEVVSAS